MANQTNVKVLYTSDTIVRAYSITIHYTEMAVICRVK
jgi:hypothetical protein